MKVPLRIATALTNDINRLTVIFLIWAASCIIVGAVIRVAWVLGKIGWDFMSKWV
jgi:hypothetical protein